MNTFGSLVREEQSCLEALLVVLHQEEQALAAGEAGELPALTERKVPLLERLSELGMRRELAQQGLGHGTGASGAEAAAAATSPEVRELWMATLALAEQARELNQHIGGIVHTRLDITREALAALQSRERPFYGPNGLHRPTSGTRLALG